MTPYSGEVMRLLAFLTGIYLSIFAIEYLVTGKTTIYIPFIEVKKVIIP